MSDKPASKAFIWMKVPEDAPDAFDEVCYLLRNTQHCEVHLCPLCSLRKALADSARLVTREEARERVAKVINDELWGNPNILIGHQDETRINDCTRKLADAALDALTGEAEKT
jgi:hypothetical protein